MQCRICNNRLGRRNHTSRKHSTTNLCFSCMRKPPIEETCKALTKQNKRCKIIKYRNSSYCKQHKES